MSSTKSGCCPASSARRPPPDRERSAPRGREALQPPGAQRGAPRRTVDGDVPDPQRPARGCRAGRCVAPAGDIGVRAAHGQVEDDREAVVDGRMPGGRAHLGFAHAEEPVAVEVPADRLRRCVATVDDHGVRVVGVPAAGAGLQPTVQAPLFVARAKRAVRVRLGEVPAVKRRGVAVQAVSRLQDVDLAILGPGARPEEPEGRPVAEGAGRGGQPDGSGDLQLAAGWGAELAPAPDAPRRPRAASADGGDLQGAVPVEVDVGPGGGHRLDLAAAEDVPGLVAPLPPVEPRSGRPGERIGPHPAPGCGAAREGEHRKEPGPRGDDHDHDEHRPHPARAPVEHDGETRG